MAPRKITADDLAEAVKSTLDLGEVDGIPVVRTAVSIRGAGDGLSQALAVRPALLHHGDEVTVVLRCRVDNLAFDPMPRPREAEQWTPRWVRNHILRAKSAAVLSEKDATQVDAFLREADERLARTKAALEGQEQLDV